MNVTVDKKNCVYVAADCILKFDVIGIFKGELGKKGTKPGEFSNPGGITVDGSHIYVADTGNNRIQELTLGGTPIKEWKEWKNGDVLERLEHPRSIGGSYIVSNARLLKLSGAEIYEFKGKCRSPAEVGVDGRRNVYILDNDNRRIQKFTSGGKLLKKWDLNFRADGMAVSPSGKIFVIAEGRIKALGGFPGFFLGQYSSPTGIAVDASGNVYATDKDGGVQKFSRWGFFYFASLYFQKPSSFTTTTTTTSPDTPLMPMQSISPTRGRGGRGKGEFY